MCHTGNLYFSSFFFSMLALGNYSEVITDNKVHCLSVYYWELLQNNLSDITKKQEQRGSLVTVAPLGEAYAAHAWWHVAAARRRTTATTACLHFPRGSAHSQALPSSAALCVLLMRSTHFGTRRSHMGLGAVSLLQTLPPPALSLNGPFNAFAFIICSLVCTASWVTLQCAMTTKLHILQRCIFTSIYVAI